MKRYVLDTNVYSAFKRNDADAVQSLQEAEEILVCTTVLGELLCGFKCGSNESTNIAELEAFLDSPRVSFVSSDADTAPFYADLYRRLRHKGQPIPPLSARFDIHHNEYPDILCLQIRHMVVYHSLK
jgi:predicted nucleic acid-binding protein